MSNTNTGGPAFPVLHWINGESTGAEEGMNLRDYFAAKAMQALIAANGGELHYQHGAADAYSYADAMLKARGA